MALTELFTSGILAKIWNAIDRWWSTMKGESKRSQIATVVDWLLPRQRNLTPEERAAIPNIVWEQIKAKKAGQTIQETGHPPIVPNIPIGTNRESPPIARFRVRYRQEYIDEGSEESTSVQGYLFFDKPPGVQEIRDAVPPAGVQESVGGSPPPPGWTPRSIVKGRLWIEGIDRV